MRLNLRNIACALVLAATAAHPTVAQAQTDASWPSRRVNIIVGFAAGGFADGVARLLARKLGEQWKQSVVVQNMAGAGGNIAARSVSIAGADGYTLLATTTSLAINETLYRDKGFSSSSLTAVALPVEAPELLVANPKSGIRSFEDLLKAGHSGQLYLGSSGIGSGSHISAEYALRMLGKVNVKHIPFQGGNPAMLALMTGDVNVVASTSTAIPMIMSGEVVGLAVGSAQRSPLLPNIPTYAENGFTGFTASSWAGIFAVKGTPDAVLDRINAGVNEAIEDPDILRQFHNMGLSPVRRDRAATETFFKEEINRWEQMVKAIGVSG